MNRPQLWHISVDVAPASEDAVSVLLERLFDVAPSIYTDADTGRSVASIYLEKESAWSAARRESLRTGLAALRVAGVDLGPARCHARRIRQEDWAESWKRHFKPMQIGGQLLIKPSWSRKRARPGQKTIILDPGLSFGTGQHPTTLFCLEQTVAARRPGEAQSFLDIGTGSGILAIAAAKLGYRPVHAFDFDPVAVRVARRNSARNRLPPKRVQWRQADLTRLPLQSKGRYDVICANLLADLLLEEKFRLLNRLQPGGLIVVAGILRAQFGAVCAAFAEAGFNCRARVRGGEWESGSFSER